MQNRYVGDIGDYVKLAILRALAPGHRLGIAWWLYPDEAHNQDGRHIGYLDRPLEWERFDPELFGALKRIVASGKRTVTAFEDCDLLDGASFASETIPLNAGRRREWFERTRATLDQCDLVFVDPDNGIEPQHPNGGKSITLDQLHSLQSEERTIVLYHHQTRRKGGHLAELGYQADRLRSIGFRTVDALRAQPFSPRAFFILDARAETRTRAQAVVRRWEGKITWHPEPQLSRAG